MYLREKYEYLENCSLLELGSFGVSGQESSVFGVSGEGGLDTVSPPVCLDTEHEWQEMRKEGWGKRNE